MSWRPSVDTGLRSNGAEPARRIGAENGERTPLLSGAPAYNGGYRGGGRSDDGNDEDYLDDDQSPFLAHSGSAPSAGQKSRQRRSLPALKKLDPYPGNGFGARTMNAAVRARDELVEMLCCGSVQRFLDRYRNRWDGNKKAPEK